MFFILDMIHLAYQATKLALGVSMVLVSGFEYPTELDAIATVQAERGNYREMGNKCLYDGVVVPYERDWEEIDDSTDMSVVRKAEPGVIAGYAIIYFKKTCEGIVEPALRMGTEHPGFAAMMMAGEQNLVDEYDFSRADSLPEWLNQVKARLARLSTSHPTAAAALFSINSQGKDVPAAAAVPEITSALISSASLSHTVTLDQLGAMRDINWASSYQLN